MIPNFNAILVVNHWLSVSENVYLIIDCYLKSHSLFYELLIVILIPFNRNLSTRTVCAIFYGQYNKCRDLVHNSWGHVKFENKFYTSLSFNVSINIQGRLFNLFNTTFSNRWIWKCFSCKLELIKVIVSKIDPLYT